MFYIDPYILCGSLLLNADNIWMEISSITVRIQGKDAGKAAFSDQEVAIVDKMSHLVDFSVGEHNSYVAFAAFSIARPSVQHHMANGAFEWSVLTPWKKSPLFELRPLESPVSDWGLGYKPVTAADLITLWRVSCCEHTIVLILLRSCWAVSKPGIDLAQCPNGWLVQPLLRKVIPLILDKLSNGSHALV